MKKGIQYSHYCGTELLELTSFLWLAKDDVSKNNLDSAIEQINIAMDEVLKLRNKIAELDKLNEMDY